MGPLHVHAACRHWSSLIARCCLSLKLKVVFDTHLTNTTFRILHCPDPHHLDVGRAVANMLLLVLMIALFGGQGVENSPAV